MHPELMAVVYRQREREREQRAEHQRVAWERAADAGTRTPPAARGARWDLRAWWARRPAVAPRVEQGVCCAAA